MICIPEDDQEKRFVLGKKGDRNLLVICLNPSTANRLRHDGTTDNIEKITKINGYDGWLLFNLSPQRTAHPHLLDETPNERDLEENRKTLTNCLNDSKWNVKNVWFAWGDKLSVRNYLKNEALLILKELQKHAFDYWCIKETQKGNPFHPSKRSINSFIGPVNTIKLIPFDLEKYILRISR